MDFKNWKKLQNGSDIRGIALEGIEGETVNLTPEIASILGEAFAEWLRINGGRGRKVAVGTDSRISGPVLKEAFISGLNAAGFDVVDCGIASTPAMFMTTIDPDLNIKGGVMLTASHLPFNRNGMKFFTAKGGFDKDNIHDLLQIAAGGEFTPASSKGRSESLDFISRYALHLVDTIRKGVNDPVHYETPLRGMKIIVDAGNGAGGFFADKVLVLLGADVKGSQFLDPDGHFPNHIPNPEDNEAMASICAAVKREKADLGIIFDTDVDRAALVNAKGQAINRNDLIALISSIILEEHPGSVIVTDSITSEGLKWFIENKLGGVHLRYRRGYKNVINESIRLNSSGSESWLAIETSGHAALKENYFLDDGAFLIAKLLIHAAMMNRQGTTLDSLIRDLPRPLEEEEFRLKVSVEDFVEYGEQVLDELNRRVTGEADWVPEQPNYEGIRVRCHGSGEDGWFLLRISLHDPELVLNVESNIKHGVSAIRKRLAKLMENFEYLDTTTL